jgi:D-amino-acid dehydrogenase
MVQEFQIGGTRADVIVLGAGIVGTSAALHLVKRGLSVALIDRKEPGQETSYGNAGIIEGNTYFPYPLPRLGALMRIALRRAPEASYHPSHLPKLFPWLRAYASASRPAAMLAFAETMRPLFSRAVAEHEALIAEAGAGDVLRKSGAISTSSRRQAFHSSRSTDRERWRSSLTSHRFSSVRYSGRARRASPIRCG